MDFPSAVEILQTHRMSQGVFFLTQLLSNHRHYTNVRVHSKLNQESLAALARALRTDFDGSGNDYIPDLTIWSVRVQTGAVGAVVYLTASWLDRQAVLLSSDLDYLKGMIAYEILEGIRRGDLDLQQAQRRAMDAGIEMQVAEDSRGEQTITFFSHHPQDEQLIRKLVVIEPPDLVWD